MQILIATGNQHKVREVREILGEGNPLFSLNDFPDIHPAEETGHTFAENAALKAVSASEQFCGMVLADDSGLEVDALGGRPGVYSARYAGPGATDTLNRRKLLDELSASGARGKARTARFRCVIAAARDGELLRTFDGMVEGVIANTEKGSGGFGYDPVFIPEGQSRTFAELPAEVKNSMSHRSRALELATHWLSRTGQPH